MQCHVKLPDLLALCLRVCSALPRSLSLSSQERQRHYDEAIYDEDGRKSLTPDLSSFAEGEEESEGSQRRSSGQSKEDREQTKRTDQRKM